MLFPSNVKKRPKHEVARFALKTYQELKRIYHGIYVRTNTWLKVDFYGETFGNFKTAYLERLSVRDWLENPLRSEFGEKKKGKKRVQDDLKLVNIEVVQNVHQMALKHV